MFDDEIAENIMHELQKLWDEAEDEAGLYAPLIHYNTGYFNALSDVARRFSFSFYRGKQTDKIVIQKDKVSE